MNKQTFKNFCQLLTSLHLWQDTGKRQALIRHALFNHPASNSINLDQSPEVAASDVIQSCLDYDGPDENGRSPLCALLETIQAQGLANGDRKSTFDALFQQLHCTSAKAPRSIDWPHDPYPGMLALDKSQSRIFFGREKETEGILQKICSESGKRLTAIAGASGSGKSSLAYAGVWAALENPDSDFAASPTRWRISDMKPFVPGDGPFHALAWSIAGLGLPGLGSPSPALIEGLQQQPLTTLGEVLDKLLAASSENTEWLLIIDQFEEFFTTDKTELTQRFLSDLLLPALNLPHFRVLITLRSDFLDRCIDHPQLLEEINAHGQYGVGQPGVREIDAMISGPVRLSLTQPVTLEQALVDKLVEDSYGKTGGLALLAFALKDLYNQCKTKGSMTLENYQCEAFGGLEGVIRQRADQALATTKLSAETLLPRVFSRLLTVRPDGKPTRNREFLDHWEKKNDTQALELIEALAAPDCRLLVKAGVNNSDGQQRRSVEVAHEALFSAWPALQQWIEQYREALIRRPNVVREAQDWASRGYLDIMLPNPESIKTTRAMLESAELWDNMACATDVAHFYALSTQEDLVFLAQQAFAAFNRGETQARQQLLLTMTRPAHDYAVLQSTIDQLRQEIPAIVTWINDGLSDVHTELAQVSVSDWHHHRARIGDLMAILGDKRPGVGLLENDLVKIKLPQILWRPVPAGEFTYGKGEKKRTGEFQIARYPITNKQYQAFVDAPDYEDKRWWGEYGVYEANPTKWPQSNRPRVEVTWIKAVAFCNWLTVWYHKAGLIKADEVIRLPNEYEWERAARGDDGIRDYPWEGGYVSGYANVNEQDGNRLLPYLNETAAVGLYPFNLSLYGLMDCSGNIWEWCLNKAENPDDCSTSGGDARALRGGSWLNGPGSALAVSRFGYNPDNRNSENGFRVLRSVPIDR